MSEPRATQGARAGGRVLDAILAAKRAEVPQLITQPRPAARRAPGGLVVERLTREAGAPLSLVAEVKLRSPSAGALSRVLTPPERCLEYARGGAAMISVLTDAAFFDGSFEHLAASRDALDAALGPSRPRLLCKEFVIHPIQLERAADAGADAVLLIARIVTPAELGALAASARTHGLEPLIEVVTDDELVAAMDAGARVVGVNARDLDTLEMDPERAARVLASIGDRAVSVHLSGLHGAADVARVARGPAHAALIGEALMRRDHPLELLLKLAAAAREPPLG